MKTNSKDLEIFLRVAQEGSLSTAAKFLGKSVSQVSRSIQNLEILLHTTLFNRTTRTVRLTSQGELFFTKIAKAIHNIELSEEELFNLNSELSGSLRINFSTPVLKFLIIPHIPEFSSLYPKIHLELNTAEEVTNLISTHSDIAFRIGKLEDSNIHAKLLGKSKLKLVCSANYLATHSIHTLNDVTPKWRISKSLRR